MLCSYIRKDGVYAYSAALPVLLLRPIFRFFRPSVVSSEWATRCTNQGEIGREERTVGSLLTANV